METLLRLLDDLLRRLDVSAVIDIFVVGLIIYGLLSVLQGTRAATLMRGVFLVFAALFILVRIFELPLLGIIVSNSLPALLLTIPVIFQAEIRRALEQIGHTSDLFNRSFGQSTEENSQDMIKAVVDACMYLSSQRWGGLIIIERETGLKDLIAESTSSVPIQGRVSKQLLENIFVPNTPLHDGAVVIRQNEIVAASVFLPSLSESPGIDQHFGTRHRAALGVTETGDAIAVVVSEETGGISVAERGKLHTRLGRDDLFKKLNELVVGAKPPRQRRSRAHTARVSASRASSLTKAEVSDKTAKSKTEAGDKTAKPKTELSDKLTKPANRIVTNAADAQTDPDDAFNQPKPKSGPRDNKK